MSGPKTSRYTLTAEQMRILRAQVERERKTNEEYARLKKLISNMKQVKADLQEPLSNIEELQRRTGEGAEYIQQTQAIVETINVVIAENSQTLKDIDLEVLIEKRKHMENVLYDAKNKLSELSQQAMNLNNVLFDDINKGVDKVFSSSFVDIFEESAVISDSILNKSLPEKVLNDLSLITFLPKEYIAEISRAQETLMQIENNDFLKNFKAMTITPLVEKCENFVQNYRSYGEKFEDLNIIYQSLCEMAEMPLNEYTFSLENIKSLEQEILILEDIINKEKEEVYISDAIDEVMIEMGYDLIGRRDVTKKSGKRFSDELYKFTEGTAVNIRYDSEGKITMELGGLDVTDRMPTASETGKLCDDMMSFCDDFTKIEKMLKARGIVCKNRISILPPNIEYAQIINTQDYNMSAETETINKKRVRQQANKQIKMIKE